MIRYILLLLLIEAVNSADQTHCGVRWYKVYENDANGEPVFGNIGDLRAAVLNGANIRFTSGSNYFTSAQNVQIVDGNVFAQALFHVSRNEFDRFQDNVYWWWVIAATTGQWQMTRYNVGEHVTRGSNEDKKHIKWFVRNRFIQSPILDIDNNEKVTSGSVTSLIQSVKNGEDIRITTGGSYSFPVDNLEYDAAESVVGAMSIWSVSMTTNVVGGTKIQSFQGNDYWWFTVLSSNGNRHMSRWTVGQHQTRGDNDENVTSQWFSDPCWKTVYQHDSQGNPTCGSLKGLLDAVSTGHRIKLVYRRSVFEADTLAVVDGHVCAQVINDLSKSRVDSFGKVHWVWRYICSKGTVATVRYEVGSNTQVGTTNESGSVTWFVDVREWQHVLTTTKTGSVSAGSKAVLAHAVRNGAELRYRTSEDGYSVVRQADNIKFSGGEDVGAMHVREISSSLSGFHSNPYWYFTIVSTTGRRDASRWTVGVYQDRGHTMDRVNVDWFVGE